MESIESEYNQSAEEILDAILYDWGNKLVDEDDWINDLVTRSYCHSYGLDVYENTQAWFINENKIGFTVEMVWNGKPYDESPAIFDTIRGEVTGEAIRVDGTWEISNYKILEADYGIAYEEGGYQEAVLSNVNFFQTFLDEISNLKLLNNLAIEDEMALKTLQRQIYVGAVTCLETFLSDALVNTVLSSQEFLESFISNYDFGDRTVKINQLFDTVKNAEDIAKSAMLEVIYHNIPKVSRIYEVVLGIEFPKYSTIAKAVSTRHDLVHRNGKTKEGFNVEISKEIVDNLITEVESFVKEINERIEKRTTSELSENDLPFQDAQDFKNSSFRLFRLLRLLHL